jgi:competence ComEA-like helix-hairpin-helix protein
VEVRYFLKCSCAALLFASICGLAGAQSSGADADKQHLKRVCAGCHPVDIVTTHRATKEEWRATIQKMIDKGLDAPEEDLEWALDYLSANYGPKKGASTPAKINVNKATAEQIANAVGLTKPESEALVKFREQNGRFKNMDDLEKVPGIDAKKLEANKDRLEF